MMAGKRTTPADALIGQRIRIVRISLGMSQEVLARKLGISFQQIQKYEKGKNRIGAGRLSKVAEILGVPVEALFPARVADGRYPHVETVEASLELISSAEGLSLCSAFAKIDDPKLRRAVVLLVDGLSNAKRPIQNASR